MEFSRGMPTIPEESFARLLLRATRLEEEEVLKYLARLNERITEKKVMPQSKMQFNHISDTCQL